MKAASINDLKKELKEQKPAELVELCLRLARFKKDNKELLSFLLFEAADPDRYMQEVKAQTEAEFETVNKSQPYFAKKSLRKILRQLNKHIRYLSTKGGEAELRLHFCATLKASGIAYKKNAALKSLFEGQLKKAKAAIAALHEDLQWDFVRRMESLMD